jgi:electron transfer flavoprotein alpha/beta subunit
MPKTIVCIKQAVDVTEIKVDSATRRLITVDAPRRISEFDKNALEEAVRLKERLGGEVVVVTATPEDAKMTVREALAMGADKAYIISDPSLENSDTLATSYVLCEAIKKIGEFDLILCGEASVDSYSAQVGPRLAERLDIPQITYVRKLTFDGATITAERSLEECYETVKAKTPVLLTVTGELNEPRIPSLMAIMKASKKPIIKWGIEDLNMPKDKVGEAGSAIQVTEVLAPKVERKSIAIKGETPEEVAEKLAKTLITEGVVGR